MLMDVVCTTIEAELIWFGVVSIAKHKVLVVDDDENVVRLISLYLKREGYSVLEAQDGESAVRMHRRHRPDLVVLDIMLPGIDGWEVCRLLREEYGTPIIMLTARDEDYDKVLGLELGADDYVTKPFNPRELVARVKAVLRRAASPDEAGEREVVKYPGLHLSRTERRCRVEGEEISLTAKEFDLLWLMATHPRRVFSREQFLQQVWGYDYTGDTRTVDTHIKRLRQKLASADEPGWEIVTVWGIGYRFEVDEDL